MPGKMARAVNRFVVWMTAHWLALVNGVSAFVVGLAFLAPWLMLNDLAGIGQLLYKAFAVLCHQLPERSWFLGGPRHWFSLAQLTAQVGGAVPARYIGNPGLGFKVAFCERNTAIFASYLLAGLAFALLRRHLKPLPWQALVAFALPMAVDGTIQLLGILQSDWLRRTVTGALFGIGVVWFAFPWLERAMKEAHASARTWPSRCS